MKLNQLFTWLLVVIIFLFTTFAIPQSAEALIRQQQETPEQILYQSRHTLRDQTGNSWQVVLFKRVNQGNVKEIDLRLVGFPGTVEFAHPQDLKIIDQGNVFTASDRFTDVSPSPNVGQFNLEEILPQLLTQQTLTLDLPLKNSASTIKVPFPVILEWQEIAQSY
jgi:Protein of unknown function (DUF3122)